MNYGNCVFKKKRKQKYTTMPFNIEGIAEGAANAATGGLIGMGLSLFNDGRQIRQQQQLQDMQIEGSKEMTDYNMRKQMEIWEKTNYAAQREQMEKANLNAGLMYSKGGTGGSMAVNSGQVSGGQAPAGGMEIAQGLQAMMMQAQIENTKADTEKKKVEAVKAAGIDTKVGEATVSSLTQGVDESKAKTDLLKIDKTIREIEAYIKDRTQYTDIGMIEEGYQKLIEETNLIRNNNEITAETKRDKIEQIRTEAANAALAGQLIKAQIGATEAGTEVDKATLTKISTELMQGWADLSLKEKGLKIQETLGKMGLTIQGANAATDREFKEGIVRNDSIRVIIEGINGATKIFNPFNKMKTITGFGR